MTIFTDAINNKFMGDCIYANHNISYPTTKFLQAHPNNSIQTELTALATNSGLLFRYIPPQSEFDTYATGAYRNFIVFGAGSDINDRYTMALRAVGGDSFGNVNLYNDSGYTGTLTETGFYTNLLSFLPAGTANTFFPYHNAGPTPNGTATRSPIQWVGVSDGQSLAIFTYQYDFNANNFEFVFYYAGLLDDVNSGFNYYSANNNTKSIMLSCGRSHTLNTNLTGVMRGKHYIANADKFVLTTGDAQYSIVCADGQSPTSQWATDMYVFDNNVALGYPAIGRVRNLLLAQGNYTIGRPVKIHANTPTPDAGFNRWLPVGTFAGKTVLMRCYSSVDLP